MNEYAYRYYSMLDAALKINAAEQYQRITVAMVPYMEESDRKAIIDDLKNTIRGTNGEKEIVSATIEADRKRARLILYGQH